MSCSPVTIMWHWAIVIMALGNVRYLCRWYYHQYVKNFTTLKSSPRCYLIWCLTITLCLKLQKIDGVLSHYWAKSYVAIFFTAGFFNLGSSVASCVCKFIQYYLNIFLCHFVNKQYTSSELSEWSSYNWILIHFRSCFGI